jgi:hypothetical protein
VTISRESAAAVLRLLTGAFPSPVITEDTARTYLDRMTSPPFTDVDLLLAVAEACVDELDRMPSLHQLLIAYQGAARSKIAAAQARDQLALERAGRGAPTMDDRHGREMVDVLRTALSEAMPAGDETRGHNHHRGAENCPVCSRSGEIAEQFQARVAELLAARRLVPAPQPVPLVRCRHCGDTGMVTVDDNPATFSVKPCAECRPEATEAWANGELGPRRGVTR